MLFHYLRSSEKEDTRYDQKLKQLQTIQTMNPVYLDIKI